MAYNRQLRNKNNRYKDYDDNKDVITIYDENGDEIKAAPKKDRKFKIKKQNTCSRRILHRWLGK